VKPEGDEFYKNQRQAMLMAVDGIERHRLGTAPLTSECRAIAKAASLIVAAVPRLPNEDWHRWGHRVAAMLHKTQ